MPESDLALLSGLAPNQLQAAASRQIQEYRPMKEDFADYVWQLRNSAAPIHTKLPSEVLIHIFSLVSPTQRSHIKLAHVCRTWRDLIYKTPEFWVDMVAIIKNPSRPKHFNDILTFLQRTASLPYTLYYIDNTLRLKFLSTLQENGRLSHLSELFIVLPWNDPSVTFDFIQLAMPGLQTLHCNAVTVQPSRSDALNPRDHTPPSVANFPRLRSLQLPEGLLLVPSLAFPTLRTIIHDTDALDLKLVLMALQLCPQLEELTLTKWMYPRGINLPFDALLLPCPLPRLRRCVIDDLSGGTTPSYTVEFLSKIAVPPTAHLEVRATSISLPSHIIPTAPPLATLGAVDTLHLKLPTNTTLYSEIQGLAGHTERVNLTLSTPTPVRRAGRVVTDCSATLYDTVDVFSSAAHITSLVLECWPDYTVTKNAWLITLASLPFLVSLAVRVRSCQRLLRALRRPVCFHLKQLAITCTNGGGVHELLAIAIEWRASLGASLEKLEYYNEISPPLSESRMERLRALVSDVLVLPGRLD
ncbi:hypothetical protein BD309DRAFT_284481 [Dichomitus squalens]|nr:hypothetical protein BD309DRAFT_284481 [Dichomitus squalens]